MLTVLSKRLSLDCPNDQDSARDLTFSLGLPAGFESDLFARRRWLFRQSPKLIKYDLKIFVVC